MNIIYRQILKIENLFIRVLITTIWVFLAIISYFLFAVSLGDFISEKNIINLIIAIASIYSSYFFFRFITLMFYGDTYAIKNKILVNEIENKNITKWTYTKEEATSFRKNHLSSIKKDRKKDIKPIIQILLLVFGLPTVIISLMLYTISLEYILYGGPFFIIVFFSVKDVNSLQQALKKEPITIIFSEIGFVVSELYTRPFHIKLKRLVHVKYDKTTHTILFTFSILHPGIDDVPDTIFTLTDEFPAERYTKEAENLQQLIRTYSSFS